MSRHKIKMKRTNQMQKRNRNVIKLKSAKSYANASRLLHAIKGYELYSANYIVVERNGRLVPVFEETSLKPWQLALAKEKLFAVA